MPADRLLEKWQIYNRQLQCIGTRRREETLASGEYHLVVNAFIFNATGQVLLQQRSPDKLYFPSYWDSSVGGSVQAGENIETAIHREMLEEIGWRVPVKAADNYLIAPHSHWISAWFAFQTTRTADQFTIQHSELQRVAFFTRAEAHAHLKQIGFDPYTLALDRAWAHLQHK
ncbi:NUDIX hydrolase [Levilactobacillus tujiorum]|uniref:NUDIX domain-containing protein n=1 Tax=Levilactobacillus tujiorum TaxID=2912243 RepID=A0ABX1L6W3_9LACO|nr:NUDIX domain-containing protein [Levilactobacillus tujiorum]MCH5465778.1 NUDIX domain-containing protein [Levilactobacillus tujiorum]NLR12990.1 NUDIX domain-containing protein [Lactobacillus sp. HBUAS51387]NLR30810.1 NUDIX domain-containing protein [Levilactobacillus tujiorum]